MVNDYIDLGERKWRKAWISKQYLVEFLRCRYRVYLALTQDILINDLKDTSLIEHLLEAGLEFEDDVMHEIQPLDIQNKEALETLNKERIVIQVPKIFRNHDLGISGIPDLIDTHKGSFLPIEIKNHKDVMETDYEINISKK